MKCSYGKYCTILLRMLDFFSLNRLKDKREIIFMDNETILIKIF